jgi:hypothetical protein
MLKQAVQANVHLLRTEDHLDLSGLLDWLAIQHGRPEEPLFYCIKSGVAKHWLSADEFWIGDMSVFSDFFFQHHRSTQPQDFGNGLIDGRNVSDNFHRFEL